MEGKNIVKKRIKGLLGIVLSVCIFASLNGMNVYAEQRGDIGMDVDTLMSYVYKPGDSIGAYTGGAIHASGDGVVNDGTAATFQGNGYYASCSIQESSDEKFYYISNLSVIELDTSSLTPDQKTSFEVAFPGWGVTPSIRLLKAEFKELYSYKLKYNYNGGRDSEGMSSTPEEVVLGTTSIIESAPTRTGYSFKGWSLSSTASEATYHVGDSYTYKPASSGQTIELYAVWEQAEWYPSEPVEASGTYKFGQNLYTLKADRFTFGNDNCVYCYKQSGGSDMYYLGNAGTYNFTIVN